MSFPNIKKVNIVGSFYKVIIIVCITNNKWAVSTAHKHIFLRGLFCVVVVEVNLVMGSVLLVLPISVSDEIYI